MSSLLAQSQYTTIVVNGISLLQYAMPQQFLRQQVYDPTWGDPSYAQYTQKRVIPAVGSLVKNPDDTAVWVTAINADYTPVYEDFKTTTSTDAVSFYTTDNARLSLYVDDRSTPSRVRPDGKMLITGISPRSYRLTRYPNTAQSEVISYYKDTTGKFVSGSVPLVKVSDTLNIWSMPDCFIYQTLGTNEEIGIEITDETGLVVLSGTLFVANSAFINDAMTLQPMIVGFTITANQQLANGQAYLYQNQDFKNLHFTATLTYEDGTTENVSVGKDNCFLYGDTDFTSSFPGLTQPMLIRYYLGSTTNASATLIDGSTQSIFAEIDVVVVPNDMKTPVKISVVPIWSNGANQYIPRWFMYFADGSAPIDVTTNVTISSGTFNGTPSYFGLSQTCRVQVDMSQISPQAYGVTTVYQQDITVMLRPPTSSVRWIIQDGTDANTAYGADTSASRRPRLFFDNTLKQYFIPTGYFSNQAAFLNAFYYNATPMYDPRFANGAVTPTHFRIRDVLSFLTKVAAPIAIADYGKAFNILGDTAGNYVGGTMVVEFLTQNDDGTFKTIYGAGVDVSTGTWQGQ